jgi:hypothetical protein
MTVCTSEDEQEWNDVKFELAGDIQSLFGTQAEDNCKVLLTKHADAAYVDHLLQSPVKGGCLTSTSGKLEFSDSHHSTINWKIMEHGDDNAIYIKLENEMCSDHMLTIIKGILKKQMQGHSEVSMCARKLNCTHQEVHTACSADLK